MGKLEQRMKITWYGHSCFRVETGDSVILIDPFLKQNASFQKSGLDFAKVTQGISHVALTHGHFDHIADAAEVATSNDATVFAQFELANFMGSKGVKSVEPMNPGGTVKSKDFDLSLVHAVHSSSFDGAYMGAACGIVIRTREGKTLLHMGDTDIFGDMALINEIHHPDIGIVPIGDRFTMGADTAALACKRYFKFSTIIPCHYGTFPIIDQSADAFVSAMAGHNVKVPAVGDSIGV
jgi:L-ascorbate metabolism protein UlaG (beta-lactamase superfamily)